MTVFSLYEKQRAAFPIPGVEVAFQPSTQRGKQEQREGKDALAARVCMIYVLLSSIKSLARTSSYHAHSQGHRPHYLFFISMKIKCLLYQNTHLK